jgi:hypothetical protein
MKAAICQYENPQRWMFTEDIEKIYSADDDKILFVETIEELEAELKALHEAPQGFSFLLKHSDNKGFIVRDILETSIEDFDTILNVAREFDRVKVRNVQRFYDVPGQRSLTHGDFIIDPTTRQWRDGKLLFDAFITHDPKRARRLAKSRKTRQATNIKKCKLPRIVVCKMHRFSTEAVLKFINDKLVFSWGSKYKTPSMLQYITDINRAFDICKKFKIDNWRDQKTWLKGYAEITPSQIVAKLFPFIKGMLEHEEQEYQKLGKWLRSEKRKQAKMRKMQEAGD